jgi:simple sugar transport system ATP-binding protein/ribose transport system ATP-binding protein
LLARTILSNPRVLIVDEPTRGVDVGSKRAIYDLLVALAQDGLGIIAISSDLEEVLGISHRVLVIKGGRIVTELTGRAMTEQAVLEAAFTGTK